LKGETLRLGRNTPEGVLLHRRVDCDAWSNANIDRLHDEVNDLKHTPHGLYGGRNVAYTEAVAAVGELLDLV
jgi:hypothetical protein